MKIIKLVLSLLAVLSLAVLVITQNIVAAGALLLTAALKIVIMVYERRKAGKALTTE